MESISKSRILLNVGFYSSPSRELWIRFANFWLFHTR